MDKFEQMRIFARVAEAGSFSNVARELGMSQPSVSKHVAALETRLGVRLLNRSTRNVSLTEEGSTYYTRCRTVLAAVEDADTSVAPGNATPTGLIRIACPFSFGECEMMPVLSKLLAESPDLKIELVMSDRFIDLVSAGVDLAIRLGDLDDSSLIARRLTTTHRKLVASPDYLDHAGRPETLTDLKARNCLVNSRFTLFDTWQLLKDGNPVSVQVRGNLVANHSRTLRQAALQGTGIGQIPHWLVRDDIDAGRLEVVLPDYDPWPLPVHALYPPGPVVPARVRYVIDYLEGAFGGKT